MRLKLLYVLALFTSFTFAQQIPNDIKPPSWFKEDLKAVKPHKLASFDLKKLQDEDKINDKDKSKPWRFGHDIYVDHNFNDVGEWTTLENGDRIWRMTYKSEGAYTLNFMFDEFWIPEGAKLYVYNNAKDDLLRPFTHHNNNAEEVLGTWMVNGDQAWIEYHQPANVVGQARITVGSVIHGYRTAETYQKGLGDSGDCNQDVDCDITPPSDPFELNTRKEEVKSASAMITVGGGTGICSGTLINNTNNDGTPYFITANHCGFNPGWAFRFNWRSPNPSCSTTANSPNGAFDQTVSGAILRANSSQSDMALVEITDPSFFNNNPDVVWSGWNRSTTYNPTVNFGVHHPSGDIQKTCREDDGAYRQVVSFNGNANTQMWFIDQWELGVTEPGSSGSGLFNEVGHLIGVLSGGSAACSGTSNNGGVDFYGRFDVAWSFGSSASSRLSDWLDPGNTGVMTLDIYPAIQLFDNDASVSVSDLGLNNCDEFIIPTITITNVGNNPISSATINYNVNSSGNTIINWNGNLANGESEMISLPQISVPIGSNTFNVELLNPNGQADDQTANNSTSVPFDVTGTVCTSVANTDFATSTTGVEFNSISNLNTGKPSGYSDFTSISTNVNRESTYDLSVFANSDGNYQIITYAWIDWNQNCNFDANEQYDLGTSANINNALTSESPLAITVPADAALGSTVMRITTKYTPPGANDFPSSCENGHDAEVEDYTVVIEPSLSIGELNLNSIKLHPNPANEILSISIPEITLPDSYEVFSFLGQVILKKSINDSSDLNINVGDYQQGVYFLRINHNNKSQIFRFIKN